MRRSKGWIESLLVPRAPSAWSPPNLTETTWSERTSFSSALDEAAKLTDAALERLLLVPPDLEARVYDAMRYSALAPGKRLRPFLVLAGAGLFGVARRCAPPATAAAAVGHSSSPPPFPLPARANNELPRGPAGPAQ